MANNDRREVVFAMNVTDLDDKIVARAASAGVPCAQLTERFAQEFFQVRMYSFTRCNIEHTHVLSSLFYIYLVIYFCLDGRVTG
jgi:cysteinyl-tRNA synthetase